jgi:fumarylacetoacetate (FAA) hydrolase
MILASIKTSSSRDGLLAVVSPDHSSIALPTTAHTLPDGSSLCGASLLATIERWDDALPVLQRLDAELRTGTAEDIKQSSSVTFLAPLPRTWAFLDGSAFIQHVLLVRKARNAEPPEDLYTVPLMYQGASDNLLSGTDDVPLRDPADGMDFESEVGVILGAVPMGTKASNAAPYIKLLTIMNDVSLRELIPREVGTGFGFIHGKPPSSFAPFVVTPDELGDAWRDGRVHLPMETRLNGKVFGTPNAGEMHFSFFDLIEHAAKTRPLSAGTILGSGTISNADETVGSSCLAEQRMLEKIKTGTISTRYLQDGDRVQITMQRDGVDIFGAIDQRMRQAK